MPHIWDDLMKMLARANPQDLVSFLLKDTSYLADITEHNPESPSFSNKR